MGPSDDGVGIPVMKEGKDVDVRGCEKHRCEMRKMLLNLALEG